MTVENTDDTGGTEMFEPLVAGTDMPIRRRSVRRARRARCAGRARRGARRGGPADRRNHGQRTQAGRRRPRRRFGQPVRACDRRNLLLRRMRAGRLRRGRHRQQLLAVRQHRRAVTRDAGPGASTPQMQPIDGDLLAEGRSGEVEEVEQFAPRGHDRSEAVVSRLPVGKLAVSGVAVPETDYAAITTVRGDHDCTVMRIAVVQLSVVTASSGASSTQAP